MRWAKLAWSSPGLAPFNKIVHSALNDLCYVDQSREHGVDYAVARGVPVAEAESLLSGGLVRISKGQQRVGQRRPRAGEHRQQYDVERSAELGDDGYGSRGRRWPPAAQWSRPARSGRMLG